MEIHMRWVPVEEALPETYQPVLLCRPDKEGNLKVEQGYREINDWWRVYGTRVKRVRFWMPMPVAPVPEEKGERLPGGELSEGQERPPWGAPVCAPARNDTGFQEV